MEKRIDLRYVILISFLIGTFLVLVTTVTDSTRNFGGYALLTGFMFQMVSVLAGLWDLKRNKASTQTQVLWTLFFISLSMFAFPVYLYKRFTEKDASRFSSKNRSAHFERKTKRHFDSAFR